MANGESYVDWDSFMKFQEELSDVRERVAAMENEVKGVDQLSNKIDKLSRYFWIAWGVGLAAIWAVEMMARGH